MGEPWSDELDGTPARRPRGAALRVSGKPGDVGDWLVPSATHPGEEWRVLAMGDGHFFCRCPAFYHRGRCRHVLAVEEAMRAEAGDRREAARLRLLEIEEEMSR